MIDDAPIKTELDDGSKHFTLPWVKWFQSIKTTLSGDGYSGYSGYGYSGYSGFSGYSGESNGSGYSGYSGSSASGYSGLGASGYSGQSGYSGAILTYSQATQPVLTVNGQLAIWIDTSNGNAVYWVYRRGSGDQVTLVFPEL
jgi:hypothetical protein